MTAGVDYFEETEKVAAGDSSAASKASPAASQPTDWRPKSPKAGKDKYGNPK